MLDVPEIDITIALDALREPASLSEPIYNNGGDTIYLEDQVESKKEISEDSRIKMEAKEEIAPRV